ncbi:hypothetical protein [Shewanella piezotolerans]|uniref:hypothetical protein n=1 Tax=Shewanella piezotolerans TaxID=404011 RepID=UPI0002DCD86A|nr:hypothetical protein [Shewanella piezotolerans]
MIQISLKPLQGKARKGELSITALLIVAVWNRELLANYCYIPNLPRNDITTSHWREVAVSGNVFAYK